MFAVSLSQPDPVTGAAAIPPRDDTPEKCPTKSDPWRSDFLNAPALKRDGGTGDQLLRINGAGGAVPWALPICKRLLILRFSGSPGTPPPWPGSL